MKYVNAKSELLLLNTSHMFVADAICRQTKGIGISQKVGESTPEGITGIQPIMEEGSWGTITPDQKEVGTKKSRSGEISSKRNQSEEAAVGDEQEKQWVHRLWRDGYSRHSTSRTKWAHKGYSISHWATPRLYWGWIEVLLRRSSSRVKHLHSFVCKLPHQEAL